MQVTSIPVDFVSDFFTNLDSVNILFASCKEENKYSYFVSDTKEIDKNWFNNKSTVGVCGATSTPRWLMDEVAAHISKIY